VDLNRRSRKESLIRQNLLNLESREWKSGMMLIAKSTKNRGTTKCEMRQTIQDNKSGELKNLETELDRDGNLALLSDIEPNGIGACNRRQVS
jgi:hypothetical protein